MTTHTHRYRFPTMTMLTLPDLHGWSDCFLLWRCLDCDRRGPYTTCQVHEESKGMTYDAMRARWERERKEGVTVR